jgi:hypothetical protein
VFVIPLALVAQAAIASSPASWQAAAKAGRAACLKASELKMATASGPIIFSDTLGRDAFLVRGTYPQRFMKGARGTMLCLVDRRTHRAEAVEAKGWTAP